MPIFCANLVAMRKVVGLSDEFKAVPRRWGAIRLRSPAAIPFRSPNGARQLQPGSERSAGPGHETPPKPKTLSHSDRRGQW